MIRVWISLFGIFLSVGHVLGENKSLDIFPPPPALPTSFWGYGTLALQLEEGIWLSSSFGYYRVFDIVIREKSWIYSDHHGWTWIENPDVDNLWMYLDGIGWCVTKYENYPLLYSINEGWLYYLKGSITPRWFYNYEQNKWISRPTVNGRTDIVFKRFSEPKELYIEIPNFPSDIVAAKKDDEERNQISINFVVNVDGTVENADVPIWYNPWIEERPDIKRAVLEAIKKSRFEPSRIREEKIKTWHYYIYYFKVVGENR